MATRKFNSLEDSHPRLCAEWDFVKNRILEPKNVSATTGKIVWWKCNKGHSFKEKITERAKNSTCPKCSNESPSNERDIMNILGIDSFIFHIDSFSQIECDGVFIEDKVIIEYDGYFWHKDKNAKDAMKTMYLIDLGYIVIRIREKGLSSLVSRFSDYRYNKSYYEIRDVCLPVKVSDEQRERELNTVARKVTRIIDRHKSLVFSHS